MKHRKGFALVEILVAIGILGVFFVTVALIVQQVIENIGYSRVRATGLTVAQERMELLRNLSYTSVGTINGIPSGPIEQTENVTINSLTFTLKTTITYVDDPYDDVSPNDTVNTDYKRAAVEVTWGGSYPSRVPVVLVTNISPRGLETVPQAGGTLRVQVFNANAQPVENATVTIDNTTVAPEIHTQVLTDSAGIVELPGSPACSTCYKISVTKTGFSTDRTYGSEEVANPLKPHQSVLETQTTPVSFSIDQVSGITLRSYGSREAGYPPVANVLFTIRGSRIIGYDTLDNPVYKYQYATNTGGGVVGISLLEWDTYTLDLSNSAHNLAGSNPIIPFALPPATNLAINISAIPKTNNTLLVAVTDSSGVPQASASVRLVDATLTFDLTKYTSATGTPDFGQTFFGSLTSGMYNLFVNLNGYEEATATSDLTGIVQKTFILNPL